MGFGRFSCELRTGIAYFFNMVFQFWLIFKNLFGEAIGPPVNQRKTVKKREVRWRKENLGRSFFLEDQEEIT